MTPYFKLPRSTLIQTSCPIVFNLGTEVKLWTVLQARLDSWFLIIITSRWDSAPVSNAMKSIHLLVLVCLLSAFTETIPCKVSRYVSPTNGINNSSCLNSEDPMANPCKNLSFALVGKEIVGPQPDYCNTSTGPDNLCVYLHDGIHYLSGETQVTNATNVLIRGLPGQSYRSLPILPEQRHRSLGRYCIFLLAEHHSNGPGL